MMRGMRTLRKKIKRPIGSKKVTNGYQMIKNEIQKLENLEELQSKITKPETNNEEKLEQFIKDNKSQSKLDRRPKRQEII